jgi:hypothetical protein
MLPVMTAERCRFTPDTQQAQDMSAAVFFGGLCRGVTLCRAVLRVSPVIAQSTAE